ncbi:hypothetical protein TMRH483_01505 [Qipengyuania sp. 483]
MLGKIATPEIPLGLCSPKLPLQTLGQHRLEVMPGEGPIHLGHLLRSTLGHDLAAADAAYSKSDGR